MSEAAILGAERNGFGREPLVLRGPSNAALGRGVEDDEPAVRVLRDARRGVFVDHPLDRAERAVEGREDEAVLDAGPGAEETLDRRVGFALLVRRDGEFAGILPRLAEGLGDLGIEGCRVGRRARDHPKLLGLTAEELHARCSGFFRYRRSLAGTPATIAYARTSCVTTAPAPTTAPSP